MTKIQIGFPQAGTVTDNVSLFLSELGFDVIPAPPITEKTIQLGVQHSPEMMCFPYKVTLGNMIELAELGAEIVLQWDAGGMCRQKQYHRLQSYKMQRLGYTCKVVGISHRTFVKDMSRISGLSTWQVRKVMINWLYKMTQENISNKIWCQNETPNIGIIGEIYCCIEPATNRNLYSLIKKHGGNPYPMATVIDYLKEDSFDAGVLKRLYHYFNQNKYEKIATSYFDGEFAGHGRYNIAHLLKLIDKGVDGIVHVLPLTCMPESTIEEYVNGICEDNNIPLLRLPLDETNSPANVETRVETFVKLILRKKERSKSCH
jgi:predicted nucleotide-binding protein (sugar kinase/HSP70/actin superfamily)